MIALPGERPADTLARIDRLPAPEATRLMGTPEVQRLLELVRKEHQAARREAKA